MKHYLFILLFTGLLFMQACAKKSAPAAPPTTVTPTPTPTVTTTALSYTSGVTGLKNWHGVDSTNTYYPFHDTVVPRYDTFGFTALSDTTMIRTYHSTTFVDSIHYVSTDSTALTHYYEGKYFDGGWQADIKVWFKYTDSSMIYRRIGMGRPGSTATGKYAHWYLISP